ncbi:MAG: hypothetical protein E7Z62_03540 [Thermoplasmata archaeon]|nr:hypothetical protein [Thermoplasmata archaeon]
MTVRVTSDAETDRLLSLRVSSQIPLPPEISLADPSLSAEYFGMSTFYEAYGLGSHPVAMLLKNRLVNTMMSNALARSQHLDRVAHYGAWLGNGTVAIEDLTHPVKDDGRGRADKPRRGWFPHGGNADVSHQGTPPPSP